MIGSGVTAELSAMRRPQGSSKLLRPQLGRRIRPTPPAHPGMRTDRGPHRPRPRETPPRPLPTAAAQEGRPRGLPVPGRGRDRYRVVGRAASVAARLGPVRDARGRPRPDRGRRTGARRPLGERRRGVLLVGGRQNDRRQVAPGAGRDEDQQRGGAPPRPGRGGKGAGGGPGNGAVRGRARAAAGADAVAAAVGGRPGRHLRQAPGAGRGRGAGDDARRRGRGTNRAHLARRARPAPGARHPRLPREGTFGGV